MSLSLIATDLSGTVLGEITNAQDRSVTLAHMKLPACSFKVPLRHYLASALSQQDCLVKAYRNNTLIFNGPIVSTEEVGETNTQSVAVTCAGPFWRLTKRIIPGSDTKGGVSYGTRDLGQMAFDILNATNALNSNAYTGISTGSLTASISGQVDRWWLKNAAEAITELSAGFGSFEYVIAPVEPNNLGFSWPQIGRLDIAPIVGQNRPDAIFEYGTTKANVASYSRVTDRDGLLTRAIISVNGWPDGTTKDLIAVGDNTAQATHGLFEEVVNDAGIEDDTLRTTLAQYHVDVRKDPRQIVTFKPALNAKPQPFTDYMVGDFVRARAVVNGATRFDSTLRVWGLALSVDAQGNDATELTLVSG